MSFADKILIILTVSHGLFYGLGVLVGAKVFKCLR